MVISRLCRPLKSFKSDDQPFTNIDCIRWRDIGGSRAIGYGKKQIELLEWCKPRWSRCCKRKLNKRWRWLWCKHRDKQAKTTLVGNKVTNASFFGQCTSRKFGMKLSSCQVLLEIQVSRPIGPMCYFSVLSLKLCPINGPNTGSWCHVCLTLWIILLYAPSCFECQLPSSSTTFRTLLLPSWFGWTLISSCTLLF